jgi:hypothetical protein
MHNLSNWMQVYGDIVHELQFTLTIHTVAAGDDSQGGGTSDALKYQRPSLNRFARDAT